METDKEFVKICAEALNKLNEADYYTRVGDDCNRYDDSRGALVDIMLQGVQLTEEDTLRLLWNAINGPVYKGILLKSEDNDEESEIEGSTFKLLHYSDCILGKDEEGYHVFSKDDLSDTRLEPKG